MSALPDPDRVRRARSAAGLTQAALAVRAGVSRQAVAAIEAGRHAPSVTAAIAIAQTLGATVEDLFGAPGETVVTVGAPPSDGDALRVGRVGPVLVAGALPDEPVGVTGWAAADGRWRGGTVELHPGVDLDRLVVVGCDPALGVAEALLERRGGPAITPLSAPTGDALAALAAGRCHVAVVHGPRGGLPEPPVPVERYGFARWQVGLGVAPRTHAAALDRVRDGRLALVGRDGAAASQQALERALGGAAPAVTARASGHVDAARKAAALGAAGVTMETAARMFRLNFVALEEHEVELWVAERWRGHPGVEALLDVVASRALAGRLGALGGYDLATAGVAR